MKKSISKLFTLILAAMLVVGLLAFNAGAETTTAGGDPSPAITVYQKTSNSVVGIITNTQTWDPNTRKVVDEPLAQGSGVVIAEGGYIVTNNHVIEDGNAYQVLLPSGEKVDAELVGADSSTDLAVLKVSGDAASQLTPVEFGSSSDLLIGSTVVAIGNPGGETLANTVTQGIVSALQRSNVKASNTSRAIDYIQHDASINNGNSGGGLFNYKGELVGINTLKYSGSAYSSVTFEGLGFAIPVDTAYPIAQQLIENGSVIRPQMGITVADYEGPDEPMSNYPPASVCIYGVNAGSPAEAAGLKQYDFIYAINGERVTSFRELTGVLDKFNAGDTVTVTVVRYNNVYPVTNNNNSNSYYYGNNPFGNFFGGYGGYGYGNGNGNSGDSSSQSGSSIGSDLVVGGGYDFVTVDVVLELPAETEN